MASMLSQHFRIVRHACKQLASSFLRTWSTFHCILLPLNKFAFIKWSGFEVNWYGMWFPLRLNGSVYLSYVMPAILYGSEALCLKESEMVILWRTEESMVRAMCGVQLKDKKKIYRFDVHAWFQWSHTSVGYGRLCSLVCVEERGRSCLEKDIRFLGWSSNEEREANEDMEMVGWGRKCENWFEMTGCTSLNEVECWCRCM